MVGHILVRALPLAAVSATFTPDEAFTILADSLWGADAPKEEQSIFSKFLAGEEDMDEAVRPKDTTLMPSAFTEFLQTTVSQVTGVMTKPELDHSGGTVPRSLILTFCILAIMTSGGLMLYWTLKDKDPQATEMRRLRKDLQEMAGLYNALADENPDILVTEDGELPAKLEPPVPPPEEEVVPPADEKGATGDGEVPPVDGEVLPAVLPEDGQVTRASAARMSGADVQPVDGGAAAVGAGMETTGQTEVVNEDAAMPAVGEAGELGAVEDAGDAEGANDQEPGGGAAKKKKKKDKAAHDDEGATVEGEEGDEKKKKKKKDKKSKGSDDVGEVPAGGEVPMQDAEQLPAEG
ncbi:unnamed protein product [Amoebophrya sp. A25]|nr:unnamed protein product [Amoebophrya sp. A25]|eukprot:GSA25T00012056001.1